MNETQAPIQGHGPAVWAMPGPLPGPPGRPPAEPIVIRRPPQRPPKDLEIDGPDDEEEGGGIRPPPGWVPDLPPPTPPEERALPSRPVVGSLVQRTMAPLPLPRNWTRSAYPALREGRAIP
jgi:hypothetical protein